MPIRTTKRVDTLLSKKTINNKVNDYDIYGRHSPGGAPAPHFALQFKFGKAEATRLSKAIGSSFDVATQKRVVREIYARSTNANIDHLPFGSVALTRDAAAELNKVSKRLGLGLTFTFGQVRPMHPVG